MQGALEFDLQRVLSGFSDVGGESDGGESFFVTVTTTNAEAEALELAVRPSESVFDAIAEGFGISRRIDEVALGGEAIENGESFAAHGMEDGARLTVSVCARATVVEVVEELIRGPATPATVFLSP